MTDNQMSNEPQVRVRYWVQETIESGRWDVTGLMPLSQARVFAEYRCESCEIVQDEEGWPLYENPDK